VNLSKAHEAARRRSEAYLGNGIYASSNGYTIWLRAPRFRTHIDGSLHVIGHDAITIEPEVYEALKRYVDRLSPIATKES
jgi:hypothetical protein